MGQTGARWDGQAFRWVVVFGQAISSVERQMKRPWILRVVVVAAASAIMALVFVHRDAAAGFDPEGAAALSRDVQRLRIGISDYREAQVIADRYGRVRFEHHWGTSDCSDEYFDRCAYQIPLPGTRAAMARRLHRRPPSPVGDVTIWIVDGKVYRYSLGVFFKTAEGYWRGAAVDVEQSFSETAVQTRLSDSYVIARNELDMGEGRGFYLNARLTPAATESEKRRAWNLNFRCLSAGETCREICDVMPDAWHDFFERRGRLDVKTYGRRYQFCTHGPM